MSSSSTDHALLSQAQVIALTPLRAEISRALARRGSALLEAADRKALLAQLSPLELYYVVKELGLDTALPLLLDAPSDSLQHFCDLDCWHHDVFEPIELDAYLAAFAEQGSQPLAHAFLALDGEVQVRFLQHSVRIFDRREDEPPPELPDDLPTRVTPDGFFYLVNIAQEREVDPFVLVDALVAERTDEAFRLLTAAKWELPAQLEEQALQFRHGRMADLGFVERAEALNLFAAPSLALCSLVDLPLDAIEAITDAARPQASMPAVPRPQPLPQTLPALHARVLQDSPTTLGALLSDVRGQAAHSLAAEFVHLSHRLLVARGLGPHNMRAVGDIAAETLAVISLGLEAIARGEGQAVRALHARLLEAWPLAELFRLGAAQARPLAAQAKQLLVERPSMAQWLDTPDPHESDEAADERQFVGALCAAPMAWAGLPFETNQRGFWATIEDLEQSRRRLEAIAQRFVRQASG